ncbi:Protein OS-9 [Clavispora lusitaniae]|nr:Protein OS-9 [Clavispora lusitaniae]
MEQKHEVQLNLIARKKTILFQNMGFLPDGKVKLNLQDENGNEIQGKYNDRGEYEFEVELAKGETETFAATVMPDLEYWGYPIIYYDMAEVGANGEQGEDDTVNGKTDFADEELDGADYNHMYHHENYEINVGEPEREVTDEAKEVEHDEL